MSITKKGLVVGTTAFVLSAIAVVGAGIHLSGQASLLDSPKELVDEVWHIIDNQYVDATFNQIDWKKVRTDYLERDYKSNEDAYKAIREMLKPLDDPYTRFMDPQEFQNMQIDTSGELSGVGIQIAKDEKSDFLIVIAPIEDTPAFDAGIMAQDLIVKIDGKDTKGMEVDDAVKLIRGKAGTEVTLTIQRGKEELKFSMVRAQIQLHPVRYHVEDSSLGKVGYIRLTQFSAQAHGEMESAIKDLEKQGVKGYILDLRSNPGGLLYESIKIAQMWLEDGTIVSTVNRVGEVDREVANHTALTDKSLVVLVDGGSASASEILSGALQDNHRAKLVGTKTFGKGLVQSVRELNGGSGLAVTIAKYLTPNGTDINKHGIQPDINLELTEAQLKELQRDRTQLGTIKDPQFAKALEILTQEVTAKSGNQAAK